MDANVAGRTIRRTLVDLGYKVHTPAQLFGSQEAADGRADEEWLARLSKREWAAVSRDEQILQRPAELEAYKAAKIHMFLLPNNIRRDELVGIVRAQLRGICTRATRREPGVWRVNRSGLEPL